MNLEIIMLTVLKDKLKYITFLKLFEQTDSNWAAANQKWLGVLHRQELGQGFIEETWKQNKEIIWFAIA